MFIFVAKSKCNAILLRNGILETYIILQVSKEDN